MRALFFVSVLAASACGPSPDFVGVWPGAATVSRRGINPVSFSVRPIIDDDSGTMTAQGVCPDGGGAWSPIGGAGGSAEWSGHVQCEPVSAMDCGAVALVYETARLSLETDDALTAYASGTSSGCGVSHEFAMAFTGWRQM